MIVSMIWPSVRTTSIVRAKPISSAAGVISAAPSMKVRLVSPAGILAMIAASKPMPRKIAFSSVMYQS